MSTPKQPRQLRLASICLLATCVLSSCAGYGARTIERDRLDYGLSINKSIKQQLLGNIVRLRYMEAPVFIDVSSVINQYALTGTIRAGAGVSNSLTGGDTASIGAAGQWEDRPTITYTPISGRKFSESLLTPVRPEALFALVQSGWSAELMFRLTVSSMNGVADAVEAPKYRKQADPRFRQLLAAWTRLRLAGVIGMKRSEGDTTDASIMLYVLPEHIDERTREDVEFLHETLELSPEANEFKLTYGLVPSHPDEITVMTRSIFDLMLALAWQVDVPQKHIDETRTASTFVDTGLGGPLFVVHHSENEPEDAFVAIKNRGYWFYIDDRDMTTKRTFGVLQILFSLTDSGNDARGPVLSIGGG
jgi:hypothetical protein